MNITVNSETSEIIELAVVGDCTIYEVSELVSTLSAYYKKHNNLVIDLSKIEEIDTSCFQALVALKKTAKKDKKSLSYVKHSLGVLYCIDLFGLAAWMDDRIAVSKKDRALFSFSYGI